MATHGSISESAFKQAARHLVQTDVPSSGPVAKEGRDIRFDSSEAEKSASARALYANYRALVERVDDVFGDELRASTWLSTPNSQLEGHTPLQYAREADYDPESLETLLIRMEHGVYV